jgi:nitrite reductase/ring-hydroxylating ferredoxin subunit
MAFVTATKLAEIPPGQGKQVTVGGKVISLYNVGGTVYAIEDTCPHRGAPLWEGDLEGTEVTCPWHGARFDVTTGAHLCPPAPRGVASYKVQVVGDEVQVDV